MKNLKLFVILGLLTTFSMYTNAHSLPKETSNVVLGMQNNYAYKATYVLEEGTYTIKVPHTHEHDFSIIFSKEDKPTVKNKKVIKQNGKFGLEENVLYTIELAHYDSLVTFTVDKKGTYTMFSSIAPGEALDYKLYKGSEMLIPTKSFVGNTIKHDIYKGYFEDSMIKDRPTLDEWKGTWISVYPYLLDGSLDVVWDYKAKKSPSMTEKQWKDYYNIGYATDVEKIEFDGNTGVFYKNGKKISAKYKYDGYEILKYKKGNRGVRFLFSAIDKNTEAPKYLQFSDHNIFPTKPNHFHIYFGNEGHAKLLEELDNWPTYYPQSYSLQDIIMDMMAH